MEQKYPILEFDESKKAIIEPLMLNNVFLDEKIPESCVLTFSGKLLDKLAEIGKITKIGHMVNPNGQVSIYKGEFQGKQFAVLQVPVGVAAAVIRLEKIIALGSTKIIAFGSAGTLDHGIRACHIFIPVSAVRDEGTSYHYLPPSSEVEMNKEVVKTIAGILDRRNIRYLKSKTWITDAIFRETLYKVQLRKKAGCLTVDMECSALLAVAEFREAKFGQLLYAQDSLGSIKWDSRGSWAREQGLGAIEQLFLLAAEIAISL